ncbi:MAG: hypothetical protein EBU51_04940, partial [Synechococcaceae bacterium WB6_3A_227]|nr:hypothetical protein [Synechococcaceae bacterium WB6_3A_227]
MSLLHAVWLQKPAEPCLALWADDWQVAKPLQLHELQQVQQHPLALDESQLKAWLGKQQLLPEGHRGEELQLSLPTRSNGLPLMAAARQQVAAILAVLLDSQLRADQTIDPSKLNPLLSAWQAALASPTASLELPPEEGERLATATAHWRETVAGRMAPARALLELKVPPEGSELWQLQFGLQAEADPSLQKPAAAVWAAGAGNLQLGEILVPEPAELLLEGLGRALVAFEPLARGLEEATPEQMQLAPAEAFVLVRTATNRLRDVGVGVVLPPSLSGGLASRLGLAITAELPTGTKGFSLGESLDWQWELMIGGVTISLKELERLQAKRSPLVQHKGAWLELRPGDLRNAEKFCAINPALSLNDALRLTTTSRVSGGAATRALADAATLVKKSETTY